MKIMPFRKNPEYRGRSPRSHPLAKPPICFKGWEGQKEKLQNISNWQERFRALAEQLIEESGEPGSHR